MNVSAGLLFFAIPPKYAAKSVSMGSASTY